jgi:ABC-type transport system substrate-binding protein
MTNKNRRMHRLDLPENASLSRRAILQLGGGAVVATAMGTGRQRGAAAALQAATPVQGGELRYALSSDPPNLDPHIAAGTAARAVKLMAYNSLAQFEASGEIAPDLAESWEISDDGLEYTFALRSGVTFHDGTPFTADDVKASIERIQDEAQAIVAMAYRAAGL